MTNATQIYLAKIALLHNRNQFSEKMNNEGKSRKAADEKLISNARVVIYEDLQKERAKRAVEDAKTAERKAKRLLKKLGISRVLYCRQRELPQA